MFSSTFRYYPAKAIALICALFLVMGLSAAALSAPGKALAAELAAGQGSDGALSAQSDNQTWKLSKSKVTISSYVKTVRVYVNDPDDTLWSAPSAYSTESSIAEVADYGYDSAKGKYYVDVKKAGVGKAVVVVTDSSGVSRDMLVTCKPTAFKLYYKKLAFSKKNPVNMISLSAQSESDGTNYHAADNIVKRAKSSNKKVVTVKVVKENTYAYAVVTPKKAGKAKVTVVDQYGKKRVVPVTVSKNYFKANLKYRSYGSVYYGNKEITAYTAPKAKATVKIGKERKTKRADKDGRVVFTMKRFYKVDKPYSITFQTNKAKATYKNKVRSQVSGTFNTFYSCEKYVPVTVRHVTKGDVITLSAGTESYTRTMYSSMETYNTTFYFNYDMRNYYALHLKVVNKYGQELYNYDYTIRWQ